MKKLINSQNGMILITFAILLVALLGFVALATEAGRWYLIKQEVSKSADAAALVGVKNIDPAKDPLTPTQDVGTENLPSGKFGTTGASTFTPSSPDGVKQIKVAGTGTASSNFSKIVNYPAIVPILASGTAEKSNVEILLVIDRSYSMAPYWNDLKNALSAFLDYFSGTQYRDKLGLILFGVNAFVLRTPDPNSSGGGVGDLGWFIPTPPNIDVPYPSMPNSLDYNMVNNIRNFNWSVDQPNAVAPRNTEDALIKAINQRWGDPTNVTRYVVLLTNGYASAFTTDVTNSGAPEANGWGCQRGGFNNTNCSATNTDGTGIRRKAVVFACPQADGKAGWIACQGQSWSILGNPFIIAHGAHTGVWDYNLFYEDVPMFPPTDHLGAPYPNPYNINADWVGDGKKTRNFLEDPLAPGYKPKPSPYTPGADPIYHNYLCADTTTMCRGHGGDAATKGSLCDGRNNNGNAVTENCKSECFEGGTNDDYHPTTKVHILDDPVFGANNIASVSVNWRSNFTWPSYCMYPTEPNHIDPRCGNNPTLDPACRPSNYPTSPLQCKQCKVTKDSYCLADYYVMIAGKKAVLKAQALQSIPGGMNIFVIGLGGSPDPVKFRTYLSNFGGSYLNGSPTGVTLDNDTGYSGVYYANNSGELDAKFRAVAKAILQNAQIRLVN